MILKILKKNIKSLKKSCLRKEAFQERGIHARCRTSHLCSRWKYEQVTILSFLKLFYFKTNFYLLPYICLLSCVEFTWYINKNNFSPQCGDPNDNSTEALATKVFHILDTFFGCFKSKTNICNISSARQISRINLPISSQLFDSSGTCFLSLQNSQAKEFEYILSNYTLLLNCSNAIHEVNI